MNEKIKKSYVAKRLLLGLFVLFGIIVLNFVISHLIPVDPARAYAGPYATGEEVEKIRHLLGLDRPLWQQFFFYVGNLFQGNFGNSIRTRRPVIVDLEQFFPATIELALTSFVLATALGVAIGIISAVKRDTKTDQIIRFFSLFGVGMPAFWLALVLQFVFAFTLGWLPISGQLSAGMNLKTITGVATIDSIMTGNFPALLNSLEHLILPALCLGLIQMSNIARITRAEMLEVTGQDYIKTAKAKGLPNWMVILKHALRNALIPTTTIIGLTLGDLIGGDVMIESVFSWPGIGKYVTDGIAYADFPGVMGAVIVICIGFILINLVVDMLYTVIDPRVK
jgi:peptide/nickel transport system permease protein